MSDAAGTDNHRSPPSSPAFSRSLVNPNIYSEIISSPGVPQSPQANNVIGGLAEFSPRSMSSDESSMLGNLTGITSNATDVVDSPNNNNNNGEARNHINSKNNSTMNSRGASTDEDVDISIDAEGIDLTGLPSALIVASLPEALFRDPEIKAQFESMYTAVDPNVKFGYFRSFRRARLAFSSPLIATRVRLLSHGSHFHGNVIKCYYHESPAMSSSPRQLEPPELEKQFLISPPASPPVGWEGGHEKSPIMGAITPSVLPAGGGPITEEVAEAVQQKLILRKSPAANITGLELMAALAKLVPGEQTEILSPGPGNTPGIVIETCEDAPFPPRKIKQTRCPEHKH